MLKRKHNKSLTAHAKNLRQSMTAQERKLWYEFLRAYPVRILRQKVIDRFIVDFYCAQSKLIIELDGSQHYYPDGMCSDEERTAILQTYGLRVIRFSNLDVDQNFAGVCQRIDEDIKASLRQ